MKEGTIITKDILKNSLEEFMNYHYDPNEKYIMPLYESLYDRLYKIYGENCGFDINKVKIIRGYPKFDEKQ